MIVSQNKSVPDCVEPNTDGSVIRKLLVEAPPLTLPPPAACAESVTVSKPFTIEDDDETELDEVVFAFATIGKRASAATIDKVVFLNIVMSYFLTEPPTSEVFSCIGLL